MMNDRRDFLKGALAAVAASVLPVTAANAVPGMKVLHFWSEPFDPEMARHILKVQRHAVHYGMSQKKFQEFCDGLKPQSASTTARHCGACSDECDAADTFDRLSSSP
jgi:TAT (twin-arginine translocation) pathway signal sequence